MSILPVQERIQKLKDLAHMIKLLDDEIDVALRKDLGKSAFESYATETGFVLEEIKFIRKNLKSWAKPQRVPTPLTLFPGKSFIEASPFGKVLIISPWNYPFQLALSPLVGAFAAGNAVTLKPSEFTPATNQVIKKIITTIFTPFEVSIVEGGVEETRIILEEKFDYIFFTGSTAVGRSIMQKASETLTPVTLELGGKSPLLIHEGADLHVAAKRCVWGKFTNAGQTCVAPDYVLVPEASQDHFIELLKFYIQKFYGVDVEKSPDYGRIINDKHFHRLIYLVDKNKLAYGGQARISTRFLSPTIMKNVEWSDEIMKDEIFGPILPVLPYQDVKQALRDIQLRPKPLAFYLFTEDQNFASQTLSDLSFGGACVNDTLVHLGNPHLPFGGVGASGIGSYHGKRSFETFSHFKGIYKKSSWMDIPVRYPPYKSKIKWLKFFMG
jgi:aldehyde dehydrogenase (NAD+)